MATATANVTQEVVRRIMEGPRPYRFRSLKLSNCCFDDLDLHGADFRQASVPFSSFKRANLKFANFESSNLYGCDFTDADMHRVNLKDAILSDTVMEAKDLFGATITMDCRSFSGMKLSPGFWYGFLFYMLVAQPPSKEAEEKLILLLGPERYTVLRDTYARRRM